MMNFVPGPGPIVRFSVVFAEAGESAANMLEVPAFYRVSVRRTDDGDPAGLDIKWRTPDADREYEQALVEGDEGGEWTLEYLRGPAEIVFEAAAAMTLDVLLEPAR